MENHYNIVGFKVPNSLGLYWDNGKRRMETTTII